MLHSREKVCQYVIITAEVAEKKHHKITCFWASHLSILLQKRSAMQRSLKSKLPIIFQMIHSSTWMFELPDFHHGHCCNIAPILGLNMLFSLSPSSYIISRVSFTFKMLLLRRLFEGNSVCLFVLHLYNSVLYTVGDSVLWYICGWRHTTVTCPGAHVLGNS